MKVGNLKIGQRLTAVLGVIMALMIVAVGLGLYGMAVVNEHIDDIVNVHAVDVRLNHELSGSVHVIGRAMHAVVMSEDAAGRDRELQKFAAARKRYDDAWERLKKSPATEKGKALLTKIELARFDARGIADSVVELARTSKAKDAAAVLVSQAGPAQQQWQDAIDESVAFQEQLVREEYEGTQATYRRAQWVLIVVTLCAIVSAVVLAWRVVRSITLPVGEAVVAAAAIAEGDLTRDVDAHGNDEIGQLLAGLRTMQDSLRKTVRQIKQSTDTIGTASKEIAQGNTDLSQRTEEQASSLEETASSMVELTGTVRHNAENARQANQLAAGASEVASRGGRVVSQVVSTMSGINDASKKIADIIGVIDGIAFQTNILALNAAVEAARAGEQGRGFAVVASEVRSLAQRSAAAAREIKTLICDSVEKIQSGGKLVDESGKTMGEIVVSIKRVTDIMAEIAAASAEQSSGIDQVNQAVAQMDEATQQNAALVEQAAAAAESLDDQAQALVQMVSVFKLSEFTGRAPEATAAPARTPGSSEVQAAPSLPNVARLPAQTASKSTAKAPAASSVKTGTDDDWTEF